MGDLTSQSTRLRHQRNKRPLGPYSSFTSSGGKIQQCYICRLFKITQVLKIKFCAPILSDFSCGRVILPNERPALVCWPLGES